MMETLPNPLPNYAERVAELLDRISRISRELQFIDGLNPAQWEALRYIARANSYSRSPGAFADFIGTTKGTASQTLIALQQKGLIERVRSEVDRRQVELRLTDAGRAMLDRDPIAQIESVAGGLPADIGLTLVRGLSKLLAALQERHGLKPFGVCADCDLHCVAAVTMARAPACSATGEPVSASELDKICINYVTPTLRHKPEAHAGVHAKTE